MLFFEKLLRLGLGSKQSWVDSPSTLLSFCCSGKMNITFLGSHVLSSFCERGNFCLPFRTRQ